VTPGVLECLRKHGISTTFFVHGKKVSTPEGRALAERARGEGHWIGNHTWSHRGPLGRMPAAAALDEIDRAAAALTWVSQPQKLFRPVGSGVLGPHLFQPAVVEKLSNDGYTCVLWNSVPGDWRDPHGWLERGLADCRSREWSLVVLHDTPTGAMDHVDEFLSRLKAEGSQFLQEFPPECVPIVDGRIVGPL
jgi:peptidoglycan-N-acetylglucosamine deacetylase